MTATAAAVRRFIRGRLGAEDAMRRAAEIDRVAFAVARCCNNPPADWPRASLRAGLTEIGLVPGPDALPITGDSGLEIWIGLILLAAEMGDGGARIGAANG